MRNSANDGIEMNRAIVLFSITLGTDLTTDGIKVRRLISLMGITRYITQEGAR